MYILLTCGDINGKNLLQQTPLHLAAASGHAEIVELLVNIDADITCVDDEGNTAFDLAQRHHNNGVLDVLLYKRLSNAIELGDDAEVARSLRFGARVDWQPSGEGALRDTAVHVAVKSNNVSALENGLLSSPGAPTACSLYDDAGDPPLHAATRCGNAEAVAALLRSPFVDRELKNSDGDTAMMVAAKEGWATCINALAEGGADVNARGEDTEATPLHEAVLKSQVDAVKALLSHNANPNLTTLDGNTPAHVLMMWGTDGVETGEILQALVDANADMNATNHAGQTPLEITIDYKRSSLMDAVLSVGLKASNNAPSSTDSFAPVPSLSHRKSSKAARDDADDDDLCETMLTIPPAAPSAPPLSRLNTAQSMRVDPVESMKARYPAPINAGYSQGSASAAGAALESPGMTNGNDTGDDNSYAPVVIATPFARFVERSSSRPANAESQQPMRSSDPSSSGRGPEPTSTDSRALAHPDRSGTSSRTGFIPVSASAGAPIRAVRRSGGPTPPSPFAVAEPRSTESERDPPSGTVPNGRTDVATDQDVRPAVVSLRRIDEGGEGTAAPVVVVAPRESTNEDILRRSSRDDSFAMSTGRSTGSSSQLDAYLEIGDNQLVVEEAQPLGQGSYGQVYRGMYHGMIVAVKIPVREQLGDSSLGCGLTGGQHDQMIANFQREVALMKKLQHRNVQRLYGYVYLPGKGLVREENAELYWFWCVCVCVCVCV